MPTFDQLKTEARLGALEGAMAAAVRDYKKEVMEEEEKAKARQRAINEEEVDLLDDDDLEELQAQRLKELKEEARRQAEQRKHGHGQYLEVKEENFLQEVTSSATVVAHFFHPDFARCKIVDKHMNAVARKYPDTKFIKISGPDAPFMVTKLKVQMLPCIIMFKKGIAVDRIVGFDELGGVDDFPQVRLEKRLTEKEIIVYKNDDLDSDEEEELRARRGLKGGALYQGSKYKKTYGGNDDLDDEDW